jgi:hypothetical protein
MLTPTLTLIMMLTDIFTMTTASGDSSGLGATRTASPDRFWKRQPIDCARHTYCFPPDLQLPIGLVVKGGQLRCIPRLRDEFNLSRLLYPRKRPLLKKKAANGDCQNRISVLARRHGRIRPY